MFRVRTGKVEEWNEAYGRVEDYLRAHRIHSKLHQQRLVAEILSRAAERHEMDPGAEPVVLAAEEASKVIDGWFEDILGEDIPADRRSAQGRVAVLLADSAQKLPSLFLEDEETPVGVREQLRKSSIEAGPDLRVSSMVPREIQLGTLPEAAGDAWENLDRFPLLRLLLLWAAFLGVLAFLFYRTRT